MKPKTPKKGDISKSLQNLHKTISENFHPYTETRVEKIRPKDKTPPALKIKEPLFTVCQHCGCGNVIDISKITKNRKAEGRKDVLKEVRQELDESFKLATTMMTMGSPPTFNALYQRMKAILKKLGGKN